MKTLIALVIACLISIIPLKAHGYSRLFGHDYSGLFGITAGPSVLFNDIGTGWSSELNLTLAIFNIGGNIQLQDKVLPKSNFYIGLGLGKIVQFQFGTDWSDKKIRIQTLMTIFNNIDYRLDATNRDSWYQKLNIHIFYENNYTKRKMSNFGFGIYYSIP